MKLYCPDVFTHTIATTLVESAIISLHQTSPDMREHLRAAHTRRRLLADALLAFVCSCILLWQLRRS